MASTATSESSSPPTLEGALRMAPHYPRRNLDHVTFVVTISCQVPVVLWRLSYSESSLFLFLRDFLPSLDGEREADESPSEPLLLDEAAAAAAAASKRTWLRFG